VIKLIIQFWLATFPSHVSFWPPARSKFLVTDFHHCDHPVLTCTRRCTPTSYEIIHGITHSLFGLAKKVVLFGYYRRRISYVGSPVTTDLIKFVFAWCFICCKLLPWFGELKFLIIWFYIVFAVHLFLALLR